LSCRRRGEDYFVVTDSLQKFTDLKISRETLQTLAGSCAEFLVHAVDVEGFAAAWIRNWLPGWGSGRPFRRPTPAVRVRFWTWKRWRDWAGEDRSDDWIGAGYFGGTGVRMKMW